MKDRGARWGWLALCGLLVVAGCGDKAEADFAHCVAADAKADFSTAAKACEAAIAADPNSTSGKAAAAKLKDIQVSVDKANKKATAQAAAEADARKLHDEAAAARAKLADYEQQRKDLEAQLANASSTADRRALQAKLLDLERQQYGSPSAAKKKCAPNDPLCSDAN